MRGVNVLCKLIIKVFISEDSFMAIDFAFVISRSVILINSVCGRRNFSKWFKAVANVLTWPHLIEHICLLAFGIPEAGSDLKGLNWSKTDFLYNFLN